jgi:SAM-dependent methyltransferase
MKFSNVEGNFYIPPGFEGDSHTILPDSVVAAMADAYGLTGKYVRGLDPACGTYTIPRVLRSLGAPCIDASDISPQYVALSQKEADILASKGLGSGHVQCADMTDITDKPYDYAYTSLPFTWFKDGPDIGVKYATSIRRLLKPEGLLLLDSAGDVERDGRGAISRHSSNSVF